MKKAGRSERVSVYKGPHPADKMEVPDETIIGKGGHHASTHSRHVPE